MTHLAFKVAADSHNALSAGIAAATQGKYCHVELWLSGPQTAALCYSSRETGNPTGTSFVTLDLSDPALWTPVPVPVSDDQEIDLFWFCKGSAGREYDYAGLLGIGLDTKDHSDDRRFCSEACYEALNAVAGLWPGHLRWHVAPSGFEKLGDRVGLYELATGASS
jgi:hypothetical protein